LETTVIAEANLQLLVNNNSNPIDSKLYSNDTPGHITSRPTLQPDKVKPLLSQLNSALNTKTTSDDVATQKQASPSAQYALTVTNACLYSIQR
jgi:hypothetical protein